MSQNSLRRLFVSSLGISLLAVAGCGGSNNGTAADGGMEAAAECQDTTLEYATYSSADSDQAETVVWWGNQVEERTDGAISVNHHTEGSLIDAEDALAALQDKRADVAQVAGFYFPSQLSLLGVAELPFVTTNVEAHMRAVAELSSNNEDVRQQLDENGITLLFPIAFDTSLIGSNAPVETADDLRDTNIRAVGTHAEIYSQIGANPIAMAATEVYESLSRGVIDGYTGMGLANTITFGLAQDTPYITDAGTGVGSVSAAFMSQEVFEGLCQEQQEIISEVNEETIDVGLELTKELSKEACDVLRDNDSEFLVWDQEQTDEWADQVETVDSWVEKNSDRYDAQAVRNDFQELIDSFEEESEFSEPFKECAGQS